MINKSWIFKRFFSDLKEACMRKEFFKFLYSEGVGLCSAREVTAYAR